MHIVGNLLKLRELPKDHVALRAELVLVPDAKKEFVSRTMVVGQFSMLHNRALFYYVIYPQ